MMSQSKLFVWTILLLLTCEVGMARQISLDPKNFEAISFGKITETNYQFKDSELYASAHSSASVLLKAFREVQKVKTVSFEWISTGQLNVHDARHEASKRGDDARLRVGLIIHGPAPTVPFFAPAWIKATRDALKLPSDRMIYLIAGAQHSPGTVWTSPYSNSIQNISVDSKMMDEGEWQKSTHSFDQPQDVVGLWIMVDSDDTRSKIETRLRNLQLN